MHTLFLDTHCSNCFSVAFQSNGRVEMLSGEDASTQLLDCVKALNVDFIDQIIMVKGPGSLTGLRIGASFALGLALGFSAKFSSDSLSEIPSKKVTIKAVSIWDLIFEFTPNAEMFFYTGTKKWIRKTQKEEEFVELNEIQACCSRNHSESKIRRMTNNIEKFPKEIEVEKYPNIIDLMLKFSHLANEDLDLIYNVTLY